MPVKNETGLIGEFERKPVIENIGPMHPEYDPTGITSNERIVAWREYWNGELLQEYAASEVSQHEDWVGTVKRLYYREGQGE